MPGPGPVCVQCGQPLVEGARFCGQCGATQPAAALAQAPAPPVATVSPGAATVFSGSPGAVAALQATGLGSPALPSLGPSLPAAESAQPVAPAPAPARAAPVPVGKQTMIGFASPLASALAPVAAAPPATSGPGTGAIQRATMVGVAIPGVAPTRTGEARAPLPAPVAVASSHAAPANGPPAADASAAELAPRRPPALTLALQVAYVPPPAPLDALKAPPPPVIVKKPGVPLTMVALLVGGVLLVGGLAIALLWKGSPPMTAQARPTADGSDALHLTCDPKSCPDGTTAAFAGAKATFAGGQADLPLATALRLGDNDFALLVDRPGTGRDESMRFTVPVAYRVRADVTTMSGPKPAITIRVEASAGTVVKIDGKPVALDANGAGAYPVDESSAAEGPADESRVVTLDLPYAITPPASKGASESGTVSARVAVSPLRVDSPESRAVVEDDHVVVAGRGPRGASVTVDGNVVKVAADGAFEASVPLASPGDHLVEVRGGTPALTPRTVHVKVTRVASLIEAAKAFEQQHPIGYDAAMSDITGKTGQPIVVEGPVLEARASGHRTLVLVDDRRGCRRGPCRARVVVAQDLALSSGDILHAYGVVARGFTTPAGQTVPEIDSQFALRTRSGR